MRIFLSLLAPAVLAMVVLAACNSKDTTQNGTAAGNSSTAARSSSTQNTPSDGVRRVTTVELRDALDKGTAVVVDVRAASDYQQNHIKGAIHIPLEEFTSRVGELPRDKMIVTYCS